MEKKIEQIAAQRGYVVTEEGILLNPKGKEIGNLVDSVGYNRTSIRINKKDTKLYPHRLQAYQKYGDKLYEVGIMVRHRDGNPTNNSWENILIGNNSQNQMDIPEQIRIKKAKHATSFVRKFDKEEVREYHKKSQSYNETMKKFGITSKGTLHYILNS